MVNVKQIQIILKLIILILLANNSLLSQSDKFIRTSNDIISTKNFWQKSNYLENKNLIGSSCLETNFLSVEENYNPDSVIHRHTYIYFTVGIAEIVALGFGFQLDNNYSLAIKWGGYWIASQGSGLFSINSGAGLGVKLSRSLSFKYFNNISSELMLFYDLSNSYAKKNTIKGFAFDLNTGYENRIDNGIHFTWALGAAISSANGTTPLIMPSLKIGFNFNF